MKKVLFLILCFWVGCSQANVFDTAQLQLSQKWLKEELATKQSENILISPTSLYLATALLAQGSNDAAYQELTEILGNIPLEELNQSIQKEISTLSKDIQIANSIWGKIFKPDFVKDVQTYLNADAMKLPKNTEEIDQWISQKTHGKINSVLGNKPTSETDMFLVNTVYFKGTWEKPFKKFATQTKPFYTPNGQKEIQMMQQTDHFEYYEDNLLQVLRLPYQQDEMFIFLPKEGHSLNQIVDHLEQNNFSFPLENKKVRLSLPKFEFDYKADNLESTFQAWGIRKIFQSGNLDKIANNTVVDRIIQKTKIILDEEGTEAAAATTMILRATAMPYHREEIKEFNANKPFIFMINKGLFIGVFQEPTPN